MPDSTINPPSTQLNRPTRSDSLKHHTIHRHLHTRHLTKSNNNSIITLINAPSSSVRSSVHPFVYFASSYHPPTTSQQHHDDATTQRDPTQPTRRRPAPTQCNNTSRRMHTLMTTSHSPQFNQLHSSITTSSPHLTYTPTIHTLLKHHSQS